MFDFWFTVGAAIHDASVLGLMSQANPAFNAANVTVQVAGEPVATLTTTGTLDQAATVFMRQKIRDYLALKYGAGVAPPISLYTAGKMCQLWNCSQANLRQALTEANAAFLAVLSANPVAITQPLLALAGATLIDPNLAGAFAQGQQHAIASEFGVTPPEWNVISKWVVHPKFQQAQTAMLVDWTRCKEVVLWYADFKYAAI